MNTLNGIPFMNISKICRICLVESENMRSVFSKLDQTEVLEINVPCLADVLHRITSVPVAANDGLPSLVCFNCVSLIHGAYKFKVQFDHSHGILQQYLSDCVKEEITPDFFEYLENGNDDLDYDSNVADNFIESISKSQSEVEGKRRTSQQQIKKRSSGKMKEIKHNKRRGRKPKNKCVKEDEYASDSDTDDRRDDLIKLYPCPICTKEFPALELREHAHTHKALKKYLSIPASSKVSPTIKFYTKPSKNKEFISLHNRVEKLHKCVMCQLEFTATDLRIHLDSHRNQKEYKCDQCERVFKKMNHLNTHRVKHLKEFPFKCEYCDKGFVIKTNYDCHILIHNTDQELPHECSHCLKRFSNPEHLNRHMVIHTENVSYSVKYRVVKCNHCLKTFKDRTELKAHTCVPIEQVVNTRFPCKICSKVFKHSSGLYNHNRNIHKLKGAKILCSVCGNHVSNIYNHMMRHSGEKPFQCNQCGKRFIGKPQLRQHLLVHSGLKPFVCSICAKAFNNLYNLQVHERIHKGDRCHICTICSKGFLEKSYLKKHMNVHAKL